MLQTFLPLFLMTFGICLFIVLMQFLWRYIDDMVGKGLGIPVLAEMFYVCGLVSCPDGTSLGYSISLINDFWKFRGTSGITGHEVCRGIIDTYHASFDRNAPIRERGRLFSSKTT